MKGGTGPGAIAYGSSIKGQTGGFAIGTSPFGPQTLKFDLNTGLCSAYSYIP
jgi:hypothetical protein